MPSLIEDYALIGNCASAALVGRDGSIDWMSLPRFDSDAFFASLLGNPENGRWLIGPTDQTAKATRQYRQGTLVLETRFETATGVVVLTDCMGRRRDHADVVRLVRCESGSVEMRIDLVIRFGYGLVVPWARRLGDDRLTMVAGPDRLTFTSPIPFTGKDMHTVAAFTVKAGEELPFSLEWAPSYLPIPASVDVKSVIEEASTAWAEWSGKHSFAVDAEWADLVLRSAITLKALTHFETGGMVAAPTTSLPEQLGGGRNWDYRYCWLRDATLTLYALMSSGFVDEAVAWRDWLVRAIAGTPDQMQIMYGIAGERRLSEFELPWLEGYEGSKPVRVGNAASDQLQLDVFGEVLDAMYQARRMGMDYDEFGWSIERALVDHLDTIWQQPDDGIWEIRGERQQFTHSKVMAWVAFDRAIRSVEEFELDHADVDRWRRTRDAIREQVLDKGYNAELGHFTQAYGSKHLDASLLLLTLVGFLPASDERMIRTVEAIEKTLLRDGFVLRYDTDSNVDGLTGHEGAFLPCSFWLVDNYTLMGRSDEAHALFKRLVGLCNDVGLLSEEYDVEAKRQVGNFPQAFTHVGLINSAHNLWRDVGPAQHRAESMEMTAAAE
ncbi:glycoside hydrolase family 15 protein [Lichenihabitans psoromatis]|uniref:glycoside hydrolase family 15 protein n=1 Tax=Lichenihabitans psoromatis TaxID=2528642 RepID=UPI0010383492|nr:glycoside hydrolase family 15 protein [Lichenihabitans psoromatis]